ncbi:MAG: hypothetical protein ACI4DO_06880 [Roseburia sp.]
MKIESKSMLPHKNSNKVEKGECAENMDMETYSEEVEIGKKRVKITLEFPFTVDPKDADRFEHMLKEIYLNKIQKGSLQSGLCDVSSPPLKGNLNNQI